MKKKLIYIDVLIADIENKVPVLKTLKDHLGDQTEDLKVSTVRRLGLNIADCKKSFPIWHKLNKYTHRILL